jgi:hypothetical protein
MLSARPAERVKVVTALTRPGFYPVAVAGEGELVIMANPDEDSSQSPRTVKQARPNVALPTARAAGAAGAVVVEDRYSALFKQRHARPAAIADALAEYQVRWPTIPIVFCETRGLAEEWVYRDLAAAWQWAASEPAAQARTATADPLLLSAPGEPEPTVTEVRAWARRTGIDVPVRGRLRPEIWAAWRRAH